MFLVSLSLFLAIIAFYIPGVSHSVYGGDSGDIILASWFGGVVHPPGYPLNTIIGWVFTHLPFESSVAYKANLTAAFLQAAGVLLLFLVLKKLTKSTFASFLGALVLALNPLYWLYAHVYEVFQLNIVLLGISTLLLLNWKERISSKKDGTKYLYLFFLFWGLAVFHHHTSILLGPAFLYLIFFFGRRIVFKKPIILKSCLFFSLGFLPYVFIPLAAMRETPINWNNPQTLSNFIRLITRADYGTFTAANFLIASTLQQKGIQLLNYFLFLKSDFSIIGLILIFLGSIYVFLKERSFFWFLLLAVLFSGPFFFVYAGFPISNDFYTGLWERFLLTSYFFLAIFAGFGFKFVIDPVFVQVARKLTFLNFSENYKKLLLSLCLLTFPFSMFLINRPKVDLSNFQLGNWLGMDILASAEPNSLILIIGDTALFNTQYIFYTGDNSNKKVVKGGSLAFLEYRQQVAREFPDLEYPESFFSQEERYKGKYIPILIEANKDKVPIYIRDLEPQIEGRKWISTGLLRKLERNEEEFSAEDLRVLNDQIFERFKYKDFGLNLGYSHFMITHLKEHYYSSTTDLAGELLSLGDYEGTGLYAKRAQDLLPSKKDAYIILGNANLELRECDEARFNFERVIQIDNKDWQAYKVLSYVYRDCFGNFAKEEEFQKKAEDLKSKDDLDLKSF